MRSKYPNIKIIGKTQIGKGCRIVCDDESFLTLDSAIIANNVVILATRKGQITVSNSYIGFGCVIASINNITIESNCEIAEYTVIRDQNHSYNFTDTSIANQGYESAPIHIKKNVWIGAKATVLKGVTIESNSVIAAHALVNKTFKETALIGGTPAKVLKKP